ncbi:BnaA03g53050D [Brassica napus]|uniref:BnaA03g53050D protein n=2 Tax=Brassica TaxID=3705 RepID=A0A078I5H5_BRANA|nr:BnaA03g53050D [Brassica napus]VDC84173.1 unnamed protein product [Brassica rapa]
MFGLGFVGNVGHSAKLLYLRYRSGSRSGNGWMNGWLDGWIFFQKEEVAMDVCVPETTQFNTDSGFIGNITTSTSVSPTSSAPLVFAAAGTLSLSIPVVDLKCKSSVDGLPDSCLQLSDAKGSNRFVNLAMLEEDI